MSDPTLAALIAARISHDLSSPLGAIANGLELLALDLPPSPELSLLHDSMAEALGRLSMLRLAFGSGSAPVPAADLRAALHTAGNARFTITTDLPADMPRPLAQRLLLAAMCLSNALPRGGQLTLAPSPDAGTTWTLHAQGPSLKVDPALWSPLLAGHCADVPPARAHFALLARLSATPPHLRATEDEVWLTL